MKSTELTINRDVVARSVRLSATRCPIATAIKDAVAGFVTVGSQDAWVSIFRFFPFAERQLFLSLDPSVTRMIISYDSTGEFPDSKLLMKYNWKGKGTISLIKEGN